MKRDFISERVKKIPPWPIPMFSNLKKPPLSHCWGFELFGWRIRICRIKK